MTSRHLVDPELLAILDVWPPLVLNTETLPSLRTMSPVVPPIAEEVLEGTSCEIQKIAGSEGAPPVEVVIFRPKELAPNKGAILHIHGGGYVLGQASQLEWMLRPWAHQLKCLIVSVEYRLAPETRFPGAVEDCYAALAWMWREAETLGVDRTRIGVKGESAGGGLAAALSLLTRDRGEFSLAFQHLTYPMLDDRTSNAAEPHPYAGEFGWTRTLNAFGWAALIGKGVDTVSPYAAPARADTLSRLPPTYLATGALDLFVEENIEFARRLLRDGVPTELHVYPGAYPTQAFDGALGATHGIDVAAMFYNIHEASFGAGLGEGPRLARQLAMSFLSFAKSGNPNNEAVPYWRPYDMTTRAALIFHRQTQCVNDPHRAFREFWAEMPLNPSVGHALIGVSP